MRAQKAEDKSWLASSNHNQAQPIQDIKSIIKIQITSLDIL